jgi:hypothetical protein
VYLQQIGPDTDGFFTPGTATRPLAHRLRQDRERPNCSPNPVTLVAAHVEAMA